MSAACNDWQSIVVSMGFLIDALISEVSSYHEPCPCSRMIFASALKEQVKKILPTEATGVFDCLERICDIPTGEYRRNLHRIILNVRSEVKELTRSQSGQDSGDETGSPRVISRGSNSDGSQDEELPLHSGRFWRDYHVLSRLGEGAYGQVFKVRHLLDGATYAVKKVFFRYNKTSALDRVQREARILAKLKHENIVRYHVSWLEEPPQLEREMFLKSEAAKEWETGGFSCDDSNDDSYSSPDESRHGWESVVSQAVALSESALGESPVSPRIFCLFMQMELCTSTLASYIHERDRCGQPVDLKFNKSVLLQVAAGLGSIHALGLVHRDVKPSNIFMVGEVVKIGDFGVAKELGKRTTDGTFGQHCNRVKLLDVSSDEEDGEPKIHEEPHANSVEVGTTVYADPEQLKGRACSAKSDIFSLGLVLFELYFSFGTQMEKSKEFEQLRVSRVLPNRAKFPEGVADMIIRMTDKNPRARPRAKEVEEFFSRGCLLSIPSASSRSSGSSPCSSVDGKA